jgi:hypothetical protein
MDDTFANTRSRIEYVNAAVYGSLADELTNWTVAERDQINSLAKELDREVERYPVVHAWSTDNGSGLKFWCRYCKDHHTHGRHSGPGTFLDASDNVVQLRTTPDGGIRRIPGMARLWRAYVRRFQQCKFNDRAPGGRGVCTCPIGSGDDHRVAHCWNREPGSYYEHGYILHEVEPNDARATVKPKRSGERRKPQRLPRDMFDNSIRSLRQTGSH